MRLSYLLRLLVAAILLAIPLNAQTWNAPAAELAGDIDGQIVPYLGVRSNIGLEVENLTSLGDADVREIRREIEAHLRRLGISLAAPDRATATIKLTLSENAQGYLWVAQGGDRVVMASAALLPASASLSGSVVLRRRQLWSQPTRMLDVTEIDPTTLLVLDENSISLYSQVKGVWQQEGSTPVAARPTRDLRGRLAVRSDLSFAAHLPGLLCDSTGAVPAPVVCRDSGDYGWPVAAPEGLRAGYEHGRNYFTGVLSAPLGAKERLPAFYSAAPVPQADGTGWLLALLDGRTRLVGPNGETLATFGGSGSDVASIQSGCGGGSQVLATRPSDPAGPDGIQAFEITSREPVEAAPALEFPGPVTALWTAAGGRSATAVVNNLKAGKYEAYSLTITCGR